MGSGMRVTAAVDFGGLAARASSAAGAAARAAGEMIRMRADALAPRRTGAMIASSLVETVGATVRVGYSAPYARIQHDAAGFSHPGGGQAGFLRDALNSPEVFQAMKDAFLGSL